MRLIVGLGNPGRAYKHSRHNIGFLLIDRLANSWGIKIKVDSRTRCCQGRGSVKDKEVALACPLTFMNLVGVSVDLLLKKYDLNPQKDMLVVFDDLNLEYGKIRIRTKGASGGHKGVESIIKTLGSSDFVRLRIGIGRPQIARRLWRWRKNKEVIDYVLGSWTRKQKIRLSEYLERAADCCKTWVVWGIERAMNEFNPAPSKHSKA